MYVNVVEGIILTLQVNAMSVEAAVEGTEESYDNTGLLLSEVQGLRLIH